ncbi:MAG: helix-turn-helix transcriptional regulator [Lachnospiraceae bacterium]|nr:helix-turn-helix transcriptional regulator [Lachnospiraceae bacterium]
MFPTKMKEERIKRGWTQKKVADTVRLTTAAISDIENGKARPSYKVLCELEDLFGLSHRKLFQFVD